MTIAGTVDHSEGSESIMRSSSQPRGRIGGNSVVRWYARSSSVGHPSAWPSVIHSAKESGSRIGT